MKNVIKQKRCLRGMKPDLQKRSRSGSLREFSLHSHFKWCRIIPTSWFTFWGVHNEDEEEGWTSEFEFESEASIHNWAGRGDFLCGWSPSEPPNRLRLLLQGSREAYLAFPSSAARGLGWLREEGARLPGYQGLLYSCLSPNLPCAVRPSRTVDKAGVGAFGEVPTPSLSAYTKSPEERGPSSGGMGAGAQKEWSQRTLLPS